MSVALTVITGAPTSARASIAVERPYKLEVSDEAASVARKAGFDLERVATPSTDRVFALLPLRGKITIAIGLNPRFAVKEIRSGWNPDPGTGDVFPSLTDQASPVGHEASDHHLDTCHNRSCPLPEQSIRTGPGYGITLGEALVSEADHFVAQVFPKTPPLPWSHRTMTRNQEAQLWQRAKRDLIIPGGDHPFGFFGAGGKNALPRWSGYTLAYRVAAAYLKEHPLSSEAVKRPADIVYRDYAARNTNK